MMGFYSVDPAGLAYESVSPVCPKVTIQLQAPHAGSRQCAPVLSDLQP